MTPYETEMSGNDMAAIALWLRRASLWTVLKNWFKLRRLSVRQVELRALTFRKASRKMARRVRQRVRAV